MLFISKNSKQSKIIGKITPTFNIRDKVYLTNNTLIFYAESENGAGFNRIIINLENELDELMAKFNKKAKKSLSAILKDITKSFQIVDGFVEYPPTVHDYIR